MNQDAKDLTDIVQLVLDSDFSKELFTLTGLDNLKTPALILNGKLLLFSDPYQCLKGLEITGQDFDYTMAEFENMLDNDLRVCDISAIIQQTLQENSVENSWLLDSMNVLLDLVKAILGDIPKEYKDPLYAYANYLTFDLDYTDFFTETLTRECIVKSLRWAEQVIKDNMTIL